MAQMVENLPAMQETWVQSLDWEDTSEESMATHSSILAPRIPCKEEPGRLQSMGKSGTGLSPTKSKGHSSTMAANPYGVGMVLKLYLFVTHLSLQ